MSSTDPSPTRRSQEGHRPASPPGGRSSFSPPGGRVSFSPPPGELSISGTGSASTPHHIEEFGPVTNGVVHVENAHQSVDVLPPLEGARKAPRRHRLSRLATRLFAPRHLMQYFYNETLYRSEGSRRVRPDELFLDLVIVGGVAALGHELRENFSGWPDIEKFILLFGALYSSWRTVVMLWNLWDLRGDLLDKAGVYLVFFSLTGVTLGAHGAFKDGIRPYVAISAFAATFIPAMTNVLWSIREPLLKNPQNLINQVVLIDILSVISALPYLAAAFVGTDRASRILFWVPIGFSFFQFVITSNLYRFLHRNRPGHTRLAIAIELMVEKYEILTMIVLGESVLGLLFESALLVTADDASVSQLYAGAAAGTAMLYALQTLYTNVDGDIVKGGIHAIRYKGIYGIFWGQVHTFYHIALILFATGLGIAMRDIAITPGTESAAEAARWLVSMHASEPSGDGGPRFGNNERWLFSCGWGTSILLSGIIGAFHYGGPRAATKRYRLFGRPLVVLPIMLGMPYADISAGNYLAVHTAVLCVIALAEYILVQMDRIGFIASEHTVRAGSYDYNNSTDISSDEDEAEDTEEPRAPEDALAKKNQDAVENDIRSRALQQRLTRRHCSRLVPCNSASHQNRQNRQRSNRDLGEIQGNTNLML